MSEINVSGLSLDSRRVKPGDVFMAVSGSQTDGRAFIAEAIAKGAVAVLEAADAVSSTYDKVPIIPFPDLKNALGFIASRFYDEPSKAMHVIGITGTNGKTSISHFIAELFTILGKSTAVMGTLGFGFLNNLQEMTLTTADALTTQAQLAALKQQNAKVVAMEVSSHALSQARVNGVQFRTVVFTNLSRDHLDYHVNMTAYFEAKKKLFIEQNAKYAVINLEDDYGQKLSQDPKIMSKIIGYTTQAVKDKKIVDCITTENLHLDDTGMQATVHTPWGSGQLHCSLLGRFNLSNILAALACVCLEGIPLKDVLQAITQLKTVKGRMMCLREDNRPLVVIDYAHTPDALAETLRALRAHCKGKLWCVFGCGGDRDKGKRPLMAKIAETLSDHFIITNDNPRTEDPKDIIQDIIQGLESTSQPLIIQDRKQAIIEAVQKAKAGDCVLIAGKGHEDYQIVGTVKTPFSDEACVREARRFSKER